MNHYGIRSRFAAPRVFLFPILGRENFTWDWFRQGRVPSWLKSSPVVEKKRDDIEVVPRTDWQYSAVLRTPLPVPARSLLFSVHSGFFECGLSIGFLFVRIQLRLRRGLFGFDLRLVNRRIRLRLFCGGCRSDVHRVLSIVDGGFGRFFLVVDGRLIFVAAHEDEGGDCYRY